MVDEGSALYNKSVKSWLKENGVKIYLTHKEGKSVFAERFIQPLRNKIYKYMTSI